MNQHDQTSRPHESESAHRSEPRQINAVSPLFAREDFSDERGNDFAVRSSIGAHKERNEDYGVIERITVDDVSYSIIIVCDGVSSSEQGDKASQVACTSALKAVLARLQSTREDAKDLRAALNAGIDAALAAVIGIPLVGERLPWGPIKGPPATTFIASISTATESQIAWLGDCRAYTVSSNGGVKLVTKDHSWVNMAVEAGVVTLSEAMNHKNAHMIMECITQDKPYTVNPSFTRVDLSNVKSLIVCSDGLWNYAHPRQDAPASPLIVELRALPKDASAKAIVDRLVDFANEQGGHDNITVAIQIT